ncbi:MAG: hypothetical protein ACTHMD_05680 [Flavisolibacter sp.]
MKKTILSLLLIGSSYALFAQTDSTHRDSTLRSDSSMSNMNQNTMNQNNNSMNNGVMNNNMNTDSTNRNNSMSSNNAYNAYGTTSVNIPYKAQLNLQKDYPGASNITWTKTGDWYEGTYMTNGRYSHIYYDDRGNTWSVAMPVTQTYVPDDIVTKATTMYGPTIYDVTMLKGDSTHANIYQIRTLENGQVKAQWIADDGSTVMDPFRSDINTEMNTSSNAAMNNGTVDSSSNHMNNTNSMNAGNNNSMNANSMNNTDSSRMNNSMNNNINKTMNNPDSSKMNWNNNNKVMDSTRGSNSTDSTRSMGSTHNGTALLINKTSKQGQDKMAIIPKASAMKSKES